MILITYSRIKLLKAFYEFNFIPRVYCIVIVKLVNCDLEKYILSVVEPVLDRSTILYRDNDMVKL